MASIKLPSNENPSARATIKIVFRSKKLLQAVVAALKPEPLSGHRGRALATLTLTSRTLILNFKAEDTTALRAIVTSYLRLTRAALRVSAILQGFESFPKLRR